MTAVGSGLTLRLRAVKRAVAGYAGTAADRTFTAQPAVPEPTEQPAGDGLTKLTSCCELSPFEADVLVLVAGCELDDELAGLCASAHGDPGRRFASFGLALRTLPDAHWDALDPAHPLRSLALIDIDRRSGGLTEARLGVDERVLLALLDLDTVDDRLAEVADPEQPTDQALPARHAELLTAAVSRWSGAVDGPLLLRGSTAADRSAFATGLANQLGAPRIWRLPATMLPVEPTDQSALLRRLAREFRLSGSLAVLDLDDTDPAQLTSARRFARRLATVARRVVLSSADPVAGLPAAAVTADLPDPSTAEQVQLWRAALGPAAATLNGQVERLAGQFRLPADQLRAAALEVGSIGDIADPAAAGRVLWDSCRHRARADLDGLAERIVPSARWDDLVLPPRELAVLRDLLRHARHRCVVHEDWQVTGRRGAGVAALFSGPSGTGKSLAAEVIAAELDVDLYRVDLSQVVSKYIGETEKNLRRVFDAAERSGAVLVIDEADALFGRRTEVKDSHDRYANIEVSYLLQRMESYRGLAILTTNLRANIDDAFVRRLAFIVAFPFPERVQREALWQNVFGPSVPVAKIEPTRLAQLTLAGGSIRNVAVHAAFLAAERGTAVTMADLLRGARSEYDKLNRPLTPTELAGWVL